VYGGIAALKCRRTDTVAALKCRRTVDVAIAALMVFHDNNRS
jgi:hypothetical protein